MEIVFVFVASKLCLRTCQVNLAHQNIVVYYNVKTLTVIRIVISIVTKDTIHLTTSENFTVLVIILTSFQQVDLAVGQNIFCNSSCVAAISKQFSPAVMSFIGGTYFLLQ